MLSIDSQEFRSSLRDVIIWCATHHTDVMHDSDETAHRRNQLEAAYQLIEEARATGNVAKSKQWKQAQPLLSQIRESLGSLATRFRSRSLMPSRFIDEIRADSDWAQAVSEVANKRSLQNKQNPEAQNPSLSADSGRLLIYFPHENLADGAADFSSNGFYDTNNVPPWDLWVSFSDGALVSWVPVGLIEAADMGVDVNPEECIQWLRK